MIRVSNLQKIYNKGRKNEQHALKNVSLEFGNTGLVCILGESGSGKTTLLNIIGGLDDFSGGEVLFDDAKMTGYDPKVIEPIRNDHLGYIFQNYYLLQDHTVGYNVKLALNRYELTEEEKEARIDYVLDMLGIGKYKKKLVSKLSGGQKQRVSIARLLVKAPDIVLADEPTGNLDEENTIRTMTILKNISRECLVLLVTHERRIARFFADRIIEVKDGEIVRDEKNLPAASYERSDDSNIYLKELDSVDVSGEYAKFRLFCGKEDSFEQIKLNIVWKDHKLFIQNQMNYDIVLEGEENGIRILDEERPKLDMDEVDRFSYDLSKLPDKGNAKLPFSELFRMAVENIRLMGKKQTFIIGILLVTAVLLSVALAEFISSKTLNTEAIIKTDTHYVSMYFDNISVFDAEQQKRIMDFAWKYLDDSEYGDVFYQPSANIYLEGRGLIQLEDLKQMLKSPCFVDKSHLQEKDMVYGRMPEKRNEVVLDLIVVEELVNSRGVVSSMLGKAESYIGSELWTAACNENLVIVGICNTGQHCIYSGQNIVLELGTKGFEVGNVTELQAFYTNEYSDLKLEADEILVREGLFNAFGYQIGEPLTVGEDDTHVYVISGTIPDDFSVDYVLSDEGCQYVRDDLIQEAKSCLIYTEDAQALISYFTALSVEEIEIFKLNLTIPSEEEVRLYQEENTGDVSAVNLISAAMAAVALIMVYFTIKSNALSRSEELTVYRLMGISKGSILKAYILEMTLITCYTSLPAVLLTGGVIKFITQIPSMEIEMLFPWWSVLLLLFVIFVIHAVISILPVYGILGKPPAELAIKE